jgi:hypothetical protein
MKITSKVLVSVLSFVFVLSLFFSSLPLSSNVHALSAPSNLPSNFGSLADGTVLFHIPLTLPSQLQSLGSGQEIWYVSSDVNNHPEIVTGAIITPNVHPTHPNIVAWAHGSTGISDICSPSQNQSVFWPEAIAAVTLYLQQGWTVAATDYQGLGIGATGIHQYLIGNTEARAVIDSVRAARNLNPNLTTNYVVSGHSQGGQAALFAGEIAPTYGTGLTLKGVVAMAPLSNVEYLAPAAVGTPGGNGYIVLGLAGLNAADPTFNYVSQLATPAQLLLPNIWDSCLENILSAYQNLTASQLLVGGQLTQSTINELASYDDPAQQVSSVPIYLVQGTADTTLPPQITAILDQEECGNGVLTQLDYFQGVDHDNIPIASTTKVAAYITARFANQPAPSNCM